MNSTAGGIFVISEFLSRPPIGRSHEVDPGTVIIGGGDPVKPFLLVLYWLGHMLNRKFRFVISYEFRVFTILFSCLRKPHLTSPDWGRGPPFCLHFLSPFLSPFFCLHFPVSILQMVQDPRTPRTRKACSERRGTNRRNRW